MEQHLEKYNEPGNILLMTGDIDFLGVIREAKRLGFYVVLAYSEKNNVRSELKSASDKPVQWFKLVEGRESVGSFSCVFRYCNETCMLTEMFVI